MRRITLGDLRQIIMQEAAKTRTEKRAEEAGRTPAPRHVEEFAEAIVGLLPPEWRAEHTEPSATYPGASSTSIITITLDRVVIDEIAKDTCRNLDIELRAADDSSIDDTELMDAAIMLFEPLAGAVRDELESIVVDELGGKVESSWNSNQALVFNDNYSITSIDDESSWLTSYVTDGEFAMQFELAMS